MMRRPQRVFLAFLSGLGSVFAPQLAAQIVQGQVIEGANNQVVTSGMVALLDEDGEPIARVRVARDGTFSLAAPAAGRYVVRFEAPGYLTTLTEPIEIRGGTTVAITVRASAMTPTDLDTVFVRGEPVPIRLAPFYERRARGFGEFFTREDMERRDVKEVSDVLRYSSGFNVVPNPDFLRGASPREFVIVNRRLSIAQQTICPPLIFIDGVYAGSANDVDVDGYFDGTWLDAVEAYAGAATVPPEFNRLGADCGVIVLWSRWTPETGPRVSRALHLGAHFGSSTGDSVTGEYLGLHAAAAPGNTIEFTIMASVTLDAQDAWARTGWQGSVAVTGRPLGQRTPWYLGAGALVRERQQIVQSGASGRRELTVDEQLFMFVTGASARLGRTRPFVQIELVDPFPIRTADLQLYAGVAYRVY
ncbi:MAG TPA: carboxypeptidase regulatory-like domain-containing protein [Gemmatimonadales bacterium]|nr:carboxypeptidase regulatory-like domain-containing protein [Gemmatimonadales bacterium]